MTGPSNQFYIPSFMDIRQLVPEKIFEGFFCHVLAWQPPWSCDPDGANKFVHPTHGGSIQNLTDWPSGFGEDV